MWMPGRRRVAPRSECEPVGHGDALEGTGCEMDDEMRGFCFNLPVGVGGEGTKRAGGRWRAAGKRETRGMS